MKCLLSCVFLFAVQYIYYGFLICFNIVFLCWTVHELIIQVINLKTSLVTTPQKKFNNWNLNPSQKLHWKKRKHKPPWLSGSQPQQKSLKAKILHLKIDIYLKKEIPVFLNHHFEGFFEGSTVHGGFGGGVFVVQSFTMAFIALVPGLCLWHLRGTPFCHLPFHTARAWKPCAMRRAAMMWGFWRICLKNQGESRRKTAESNNIQQPTETATTTTTSSWGNG